MAGCWICEGATGVDPVLGDLGFVRCHACSFVFKPAAAGAVSEMYESGAYQDVRGVHYGHEDEARRRDARVRLRFVAGHAAGGRLLDVGAAGGAFVAEAVTAGYDAFGIEPTPAFAAHARDDLGVDVRTGTLEEADLEPASLDVATMWHVLEHVPEPVGQLRRVRDALRPGAVLAVEVPNAGGLAARRMGAAWPSLEPDVHVNQFEGATLCGALERAGFLVDLVCSLPITPFLPPRARLDPRHLAARAKVAVRRGGHELLRGVARRPI